MVSSTYLLRYRLIKKRSKVKHLVNVAYVRTPALVNDVQKKYKTKVAALFSLNSTIWYNNHLK